MFGGTQEQLQQQQHPPQTQPSATITTTAEEEALKRNTDCVYFLASPLTCKKGSECEYRHSEIARVNPRDCWFWLNGNCLNPKCSFRHPPLDGLLGAQVPTPVGHSLPPSQAIPPPAAQSPYVQGKQVVPCIFFQKGYCLKGDKCPFLHGPNSANNKVAQSATATPVNESLTTKKALGGTEKSTQDWKFSQTNVSRSVELPPQAKPVTKVETAPFRNAVANNKNVQISTSVDDEILKYRPSNIHPNNGSLVSRSNRVDDETPRYRPINVHANNGSSVSRSNRALQVHLADDQSILNSKDADEFSREPSPGFDVLVDDELRDSDYYPIEDQFEQNRGHKGRDLDPINDYDIGRSADYNSMPDVDQDIYRDPLGYDSFERQQGHYDREGQRASSERMLGGPGHVERRRYPRDERADRIDESDLRYRLSKQKRGNGLRSVISRDHARDNRAEDRIYHPPRRDTRYLHTHDSSVSNRLRGRIKIPGRSTSPLDKYDPRPEREMDRGRHHSRLSPERPQERFRDRIKGRVQENFNNEERTFRGSRDIINDNNAEFTRPKSLAELKVGKHYEHQTDERQPLGKRKYPTTDISEGDLSFEGPKPLSEILKRKRGGEVAVDGSGTTSANYGVNNQSEGKETKGLLSSIVSNEEPKLSAGVISGTEKKNKSTGGRSSVERNASEPENEEGMIADDTMDNHELEVYDQREGDSVSEQGDIEDYNLDEGENADPEEEYFEDDDADDFAKKMGVMYS